MADGMGLGKTVRQNLSTFCAKLIVVVAMHNAPVDSIEAIDRGRQAHAAESHNCLPFDSGRKLGKRARYANVHQSSLNWF